MPVSEAVQGNQDGDVHEISRNLRPFPASSFLLFFFYTTLPDGMNNEATSHNVIAVWPVL